MLVLWAASAQAQAPLPPRPKPRVAPVTNVTMDGYKTAKSYGWDPSETFGYKIQVTGGTPAPTNKLYF